MALQVRLPRHCCARAQQSRRVQSAGRRRLRSALLLSAVHPANGAGGLAVWWPAARSKTRLGQAAAAGQAQSHHNTARWARVAPRGARAGRRRTLASISASMLAQSVRSASMVAARRNVAQCAHGRASSWPAVHSLVRCFSDPRLRRLSPETAPSLFHAAVSKIRFESSCGELPRNRTPCLGDGERS